MNSNHPLGRATFARHPSLPERLLHRTLAALLVAASCWLLSLAFAFDARASAQNELPVGAKPTPALEGEVTFGSGSVDWGFANRWRCYVVGMISRGGIEVSAGATKIPGTEANGSMCDLDRSGSEAISFPVIGDFYDADLDSLSIQTKGKVRFWGHAWHTPGDTTPQLDTTVSDIYIAAEGGEGTLFADVSAKSMDDPEVTEYEDISLVDLDFSEVTPEERAKGIDWSEVPASLTEEGAAVFGSYPEGEPFDPVGISADFGTPDGEDPDPEPISKPGRIESPGTARANRGGVVKVARVICPPGTSACSLSAPKRASVKAGGRSVSVKVKAPAKVAAGSRSDVKLVLGKKGRKLLKAAGKAKAKLRLTVTRDGKAVSKNVRLSIRS
jgi:hypothetical protein